MSNLAEQKIPTVEVVENLSNEEYHALPSFSSSQIKTAVNHPMRFFDAKYISKTMTPPQRKVFDLGGAVHSKFMEPHVFDSEFVIAPKINKRTNAGKEEWANWLAMNEHRTLMTAEQGEEIDHMVNALNADKSAVALRNGSLVENSIFWTDAETGLNLKVRPDLWRKGLFLGDLKTCRDASIHGFSRDLYNFGYHISAAMYLDGVNQLEGEEISDYTFICVESSEPYLTAVYTLAEEAIEIGYRQYREGLERIAEAVQTGTYHGYNDDQVAEISLPQWVLNKEQI